MDSRSFPVVVRGGQGYAKGGLAKAADKVRGAGRMGDDMVVHVNGREYREMCKRWGAPTKNPKTGMPEFFLGEIRDWFGENEWAQYALPAAVGYLGEGIGSTIGGGISDTLGLGLSPEWSTALGTGLLGAGANYLATGSGKSALMGGLIGGATPYLAGQVSSMFGGGGGGLPTVAQGGMGPDMPGSSGGGDGSFFTSSPIGKAARVGLPALMLASAFMGGSGSGSGAKAAEREMTPEQRRQREQFYSRLPQVQFKRTPIKPVGDPLKYGYGAEQQHFENNQLPGYAKGGRPQPGGALSRVAPRPEAQMGHLPDRYVQGPGTGRSDSVPAVLSTGEYVIDAETTALLGDGSPEAGARRLDEMRANVRKHKGKALARGKISPNAKQPTAYIKGAK